jgi:excisionase family DNA binding protein
MQAGARHPARSPGEGSAAMYGYDELFTTRQAAAFLGVGEPAIRLAVREGRLRAWRMPNRKEVLIRKRDLLPFLDTGRESLGPRQLSLFGEREQGAAA